MNKKIIVILGLILVAIASVIFLYNNKQKQPMMESAIQKNKVQAKVLKENETALIKAEQLEAVDLKLLQEKKTEDENKAKLMIFKETQHIFNFEIDSIVPNDAKAVDMFFLMLDTLDENNLVNKLTITGYTDNIGADSYNIKLSSKRAHSLNTRLKKYQFDKEYKANGRKHPIASNKTVEGRALNRRIEISIK